MDTAKFITYFKNKISKEIDNIKDAFEQGRIPKENYDITVGELKGLRTEEKLEKNHPIAVGHRILVQVLDVQDKTKGGIYLPGKAVEDHRSVASIGKVIQMGDDAYKREDMTIPWCKMGDNVMFGKYAGHRFQCGKSELRIMNDDEILATVPDVTNIS